jgi:hypothetical protein
MQRGTATKVGASSITVRSKDGFEQTYAITAGTGVRATRNGVAGIAKGADVAVVGVQKGGTVTALDLADLAALGGGGLGRLGGPDGTDGDGPTSAPSTSTEGGSYGA